MPELALFVTSVVHAFAWAALAFVFAMAAWIVASTLGLWERRS